MALLVFTSLAKSTHFCLIDDLACVASRITEFPFLRQFLIKLIILIFVKSLYSSWENLIKLRFSSLLENDVFPDPGFPTQIRSFCSGIRVK